MVYNLNKLFSDRANKDKSFNVWKMNFKPTGNGRRPKSLY